MRFVFSVGRYLVMLVCLVALSSACAAKSSKTPIFIDPIPSPLRSDVFRITIDGQRSPAFHAVTGYYFLNFEVAKPVMITVTASDPHFWDQGVEVQPMRFGIRPHRQGSSITFPIPGPGKYVITRPGDHFADATMLFLFANAPERSVAPATPGLRYYAPGIHHENIDAHDGDRIYLAPGAVIFGSLNIWQVHHVHVFGGGTIIYNGPQNPHDDEGWMHKRNWHCIVMDNASDIEIDGITCIVRSRTWQIQMRDSRRIGFYNIKVIGGSPNNANQDGMDWLGGGDTTVANSFFRAADDDFAIQGNWDGYSAEAMATPGHDVSNITIRDSVVSTSISNTMRVNWPHKHFNSYHVQMLNMDVVHTGFGACGVPFAMFELWADPAGSGSQSDYLFQNIRLGDWYSLLGIYQPNPEVHDIRFRDIWALDSPAMAPSAISGYVSDVSFINVDVRGKPATRNSDIPLVLSNGASEPAFQAGPIDAAFTYSSGVLRPHTPINFHAKQRAAVQYTWLFGDGASASGAEVTHTFADGSGTLLDGSGRYRVLLHATNQNGNEAWSSRSIVIARHASDAALGTRPSAPGWNVTHLQDGETQYDGYIDIPADGGYVFTLLTSTTAQLTLDGLKAVNPPAQPQVCGSIGNAVQPLRLSAVLRKGLHRLTITQGAEPENAALGSRSFQPELIWDGLDQISERIPESAIQHVNP